MYTNNYLSLKYSIVEMTITSPFYHGTIITALGTVVLAPRPQNRVSRSAALYWGEICKTRSSTRAGTLQCWVTPQLGKVLPAINY